MISTCIIYRFERVNSRKWNWYFVIILWNKCFDYLQRQNTWIFPFSLCIFLQNQFYSPIIAKEKMLSGLRYSPIQWSIYRCFTVYQIQCGAVITWYNMSWYFTQYCNHSSRTQARLWAHKKHPTPRPHRRDTGCLLWEFWRKITVLYNGIALYCSTMIKIWWPTFYGVVFPVCNQTDLESFLSTRQPYIFVWTGQQAPALWHGYCQPH